jgi:branched-subunit amino acid ABC-type transport system permease component
LTFTFVKNFFGGDPALSVWVALILVPFCISAAGFVVERLAMRRIYAEEHSYQMLVSYAFILIFLDVIQMIWGKRTRHVFKPPVINGSIHFAGATIPLYNIFIILLCVGVGILLWWVLYRTKIGNMIRASVSDRETANALGINVPRLYTTVFMGGTALAGLAGVAFAAQGAIVPGMDMHLVLQCFIVVVIGGLGNLLGCVLGALIIGEVYAFGILILPDLALAFIFIVMAVVMIIRPQGLLGRPIE